MGTMGSFATIIVSISLIVLLAWIIWRHICSRKWLPTVAGFVGLALYTIFLRLLFGFPTLSGALPMGSQDGFLPLAMAMYLCMLAGMGAEYMYHYVDAPDTGKMKFELRTFLKPFFISPMVFMPLAASLENANLDVSKFDAARLMVF